MFLFSSVAFLFRWAYWLVFNLGWFALTVVPMIGLLGLAAAAYFQPDELMLVLRTIVGQEVDMGSDGVDHVPVV